MSNSGHDGATRTGRLTPAEILAAAIELLDEVGLPDLSMRRLAAKLDSQPSGLYWHFENKQTLLAKISDVIVEHTIAVEAPATPWQAQTMSSAMAFADSLLAFRDGAEVVSSTLALGLGASKALERIRQPMLAGGVPADIAGATAESILFMVLGQVWHRQQRMAADSLGVTSAAASTTPEQLATGASAQPIETGVGLILAGLSQRLVV